MHWKLVYQIPFPYLRLLRHFFFCWYLFLLNCSELFFLNCSRKKTIQKEQFRTIQQIVLNCSLSFTAKDWGKEWQGSRKGKRKGKSKVKQIVVWNYGWSSKRAFARQLWQGRCHRCACERASHAITLVSLFKRILLQFEKLIGILSKTDPSESIYKSILILFMLKSDANVRAKQTLPFRWN